VFFFSDHHILVTILFTPLAGAFILLFVPGVRTDLQRKIANCFGVLGFAVSLLLWWKFKSNSAEPFQFVADANWIPSLDVHFRLGIDGISLLTVMLTTLLGTIAILSSWSAVRRREKEYYILLLLTQASLLGVFMSLDFVLFYVFWEAMLVPIYFLIAAWGHESGPRAALKFVVYTIAGSVVMLLAILAIYHARGTFDMREILIHPFSAQSGHLQNWLFWGFFFAFAIKVPMFPFHTWLADVLSEAPTGVAVTIAGALLKTGTYGFLRFSVTMFPNAALQYRSLLITLSVIAILYGALICLAQKDMNRLIAYSSVSQMGFCTLGIFLLSSLGFYGSVILQVSHGLTTAALLVIAGMLYERRRTNVISEFGGLASSMPKLAATYLIITCASLGLPLLSAFVGEFSILRGAFDRHWPIAACALLGVILGAAYLLWLYGRVMLGSATSAANENLPDLHRRELATLVTVIILTVWIGLYPAPLFRVLRQPIERIVNPIEQLTSAVRRSDSSERQQSGSHQMSSNASLPSVAAPGNAVVEAK
jgi:NADH-quinone oxidoreductase subunit M